MKDKFNEHWDSDNFPSETWDVAKLECYAVQLYQEAESLQKRSAVMLWLAGRALGIIKLKTKHGNWLNWVKDHKMSPQTVAEAIRLANTLSWEEVQDKRITEAKVLAGIVAPAWNPLPIAVKNEPAPAPLNVKAVFQEAQKPSQNLPDEQADQAAPKPAKKENPARLSRNPDKPRRNYRKELEEAQEKQVQQVMTQTVKALAQDTEPDRGQQFVKFLKDTLSGLETWNKDFPEGFRGVKTALNLIDEIENSLETTRMRIGEING